MAYTERPTVMISYDNGELGCEAIASEDLDVVILDYPEGKIIRLQADGVDTGELLKRLHEFEMMLKEE